MTTAVRIPCPLSDEQCASLVALEDTIPQVQAIVNECEASGLKIPGAAASLANSLTAVRAARKIIATYMPKPNQE